jgi:hypothetical protein
LVARRILSSGFSATVWRLIPQTKLISFLLETLLVHELSCRLGAQWRSNQSLRPLSPQNGNICEFGKRAPRKSQFEKVLNVIIASTTPDVFTDARESLIGRYVDGKPNKALAVQPVYRQYFRSELHEDETVAGDRTLEACQLRFAKPCALIAVNEDIVAEGQEAVEQRFGVGAGLVVAAGHAP